MSRTLTSIVAVLFLTVTFVQVAEARLPASSESRFHMWWGCETVSEGLLAIEQAGDSVHIQVFGGGLPFQPRDYGAGIREGLLSASEFRMFWDSLNGLGFWRLKNEYSGNSLRTGEEGGSISVSFIARSGRKTSKTMRYSVPRSCPLEFRRVYSLFDSMARFAESVPDWRTLLRYDTAPPIKEFKDRYQSAALRAIGAIRDSQALDTLLTMLLADGRYSSAIVGALGNIGSRRAVPALEQFLAMQEVKTHSRGTRDKEALALATAKVLVAVDSGQSVPTILRYLSKSYHRSYIADWCGLLAGVGDYSLVPEVVQILSDYSRYRHEYVSGAAGILEKTGYESQYVISALFQTTETELKRNDPDNGIVAATVSALRKLTGQEFAYRPEDSLAVKRSEMAKWLKWWKANARNFPAGTDGGAVGGHGFIRVNSKPADAAISLDTTSTGKTTPFLLLNVPAGRHDLRLTKERYADWSSSVTVAQARTTTVSVVLRKSFGSLEINSSPSGVAISLDGTNTGTVTPHLFAKVATGRHRLGLTKTGYPGWDSTVVVARKQTTAVRAALQSPPESLWITYANVQAAGWLNWQKPERAVRFSARTGFGYPLRIVKVSAVFQVWKEHLWPDSSFRFKIYGGDGQTLLYQSPVLEAIPGEPGPTVVHELSSPIRVDSGEFYVSVAPIDTGGVPASLVWSKYSSCQVPPGVPEDTSAKRSYTGSPGHWSPLTDGELAMSVLVRR